MWVFIYNVWTGLISIMKDWMIPQTIYSLIWRERYYEITLCSSSMQSLMDESLAWSNDYGLVRWLCLYTIHVEKEQSQNEQYETNNKRPACFSCTLEYAGMLAAWKLYDELCTCHMESTTIRKCYGQRDAFHLFVHPLCDIRPVCRIPVWSLG